MLPTCRPGDLVIVRRQASYGIGDVVAYRIPNGRIGAGIILIHRIVGGSATDGFIVRGDNNPDPDDWRPTYRDVVGKAWLTVPRVGLVLALLHAPLPLASLGASIAVILVIDPDKKRPGDGPEAGLGPYRSHLRGRPRPVDGPPGEI
jgi:signal peptidase I